MTPFLSRLDSTLASATPIASPTLSSSSGESGTSSGSRVSPPVPFMSASVANMDSFSLSLSYRKGETLSASETAFVSESRPNTLESGLPAFPTTSIVPLLGPTLLITVISSADLTFNRLV